MKKFLRRSLLFVLFVGLPSTYATYNIFQPEQFPIKFFRGEVVQVSDDIIIGPYPTEKEIKRLKKMGIQEFISLMNPSMPFESPLIKKELELAEKHKISFKNIPLSYLPDLESMENLEKVENLIAYTKGNKTKKYVHCYLGRHRTTLFKTYYLQSQNPS
ncbi:MAG TPA: hypothetical protein VGB26_05375 [Nitrospiria bacterium]|jgi:protein tyrosine phosphatase (PTP) superfamily phosphohydrolase (DUF442 family)